jgi:hypothetical protein
MVGSDKATKAALLPSIFFSVESAKILNGPATLALCRKKGQLLHLFSRGTTVMSGMALTVAATASIKMERIFRELVVGLRLFSGEDVVVKK